jgi:TfoX/Sxy family transcriptional regulator of competence genes
VLAILASGGSFDRANVRLACRQAQRPFGEMIDILRRKADKRFTPPGSGPEAPLTDLLVHGLDIRALASLTRPTAAGPRLHVDERMVVCVSGGGSDLLVRVAPERDAELVARPGAQRAEMGKDRSMDEGWITVEEQALESSDDLQLWMDVALEFHAQGSGRKQAKK